MPDEDFLRTLACRIPTKCDADAYSNLEHMVIYHQMMIKMLMYNQGNDLLNIPTELSPVKPTEKVPPRSVFGRVGSVLGLR